MQQSSTQNNNDNEEIDLSELKEALQTLVDQGCVLLRKISKQPLDMGEKALLKAAENSKGVVDKCMASAKEHPIEALLIAFGLGFLVVRFLKGK